MNSTTPFSFVVRRAGMKKHPPVATATAWFSTAPATDRDSTPYPSSSSRRKDSCIIQSTLRNYFESHHYDGDTNKHVKDPFYNYHPSFHTAAAVVPQQQHLPHSQQQEQHQHQQQPLPKTIEEAMFLMNAQDTQTAMIVVDCTKAPYRIVHASKAWEEMTTVSSSYSLNSQPQEVFFLPTTSSSNSSRSSNNNQLSITLLLHCLLRGEQDSTALLNTNTNHHRLRVGPLLVSSSHTTTTTTTMESPLTHFVALLEEL